MAVPGIPTNFNIQSGNQQILLTWNLTAGATSYTIKRSTDQLNYIDLIAVTSTQYLDSEVTLGTQYYYKIAACNVSATGNLTCTGLPNAGGFFKVADIQFTAVSSSPSENQFVVASTIADTLTNIVNAVNSSASFTGNIVAVVLNSNTVQFTAIPAGPIGNSTQFSVGLSNTTITPFSGGTSGLFTSAASAVPTSMGEMCLSQIRLASQQRADRVNSNFITMPEWNQMINQSMYELYDLLITTYADYYLAPAMTFTADGSTYLYPLPNGTNYSGVAAFYKMMGVDLCLNTANNAWVTINKFNFIDRNKFVYPNTASTIYGVFNLQYRVMGSNIEFIPTPTGGQQIRIWYVPRLPQLLLDTDITTSSVSGWIEYVIVDAAIKALQKEESDVSVLMAQKAALKMRIEESASNRDAGAPDKISDVRSNSNPWGFNGPISGFGGGF